MSLSDSILLMKNDIAYVEEHLNKLQSGRKASSAKARASLMSLKKSSHQLRADIMKYTKELPTKSRTKSETKEPEAEPEVKEKKVRKPRVRQGDN